MQQHESQKHYAKWKKSDSKHKIYANFLKNQKYRDKKQIHAFGVGAGFDCKWAPGDILGRLKYSITELRILDYCINLHKINEL